MREKRLNTLLLNAFPTFTFTLLSIICLSRLRGWSVLRAQGDAQQNSLLFVSFSFLFFTKKKETHLGFGNSRQKILLLLVVGRNTFPQKFISSSSSSSS